MENSMRALFQGAVILLFMCCVFDVTQAQSKDTASGYIIRHESDIGQAGPGPHNGTGETIGYCFFDDVTDFKLIFRKRILHPGASIGLHKQVNDEVYYCASGSELMTINGREIDFRPGDAVLTRTGSSHELRQTGTVDLVIFISYEKTEKK
jgi:mannose-6-phosphate isomerase-like protein (cupin superfamily)